MQQNNAHLCFKDSMENSLIDFKSNHCNQKNDKTDRLN